MKSVIHSAVVVLSLVAAPLALAGPATDRLGVCLTDSLNGKERKDLAKWIFMGMATHPSMADHARIKDKDRKATDKQVGTLITRLLADDCAEEATRALETDGSMAFQQAFGLVGQVAMQELMQDENVNQALSGFEAYLDEEKLQALNPKAQ